MTRLLLRQRLARSGYSTLLRMLKPVYLMRLWWRGRAEPLYRHAIGERLGAYQGERTEGWVWVHAVSLGETRAAAALIEALRVRIPGMRLLLTHSTATGREAGEALLREGDRQAWLPYDTPGVVERFFSQFAPSVGVLMETEIWPNLLHCARRHGVRVVLANARLSEKSQKQGQRLAVVLHPAVESLSLVLAQTAADAARLRQAGAPQVSVSGNLKFDMAPDEALVARGRAWRSMLDRPVLLFAVSREGEEAMLLAAWSRLAVPAKPLLLVVPRHPQRFDEVAALVKSSGLTLARRSEWTDTPPADALAADAWLGDSMREMPLYYGLGDVALLGGSFAPLGGQNLIEAAACGCPVVMGPHTFNFAEAAELAEAASAAVRVKDIDEGLATALRMIEDPSGLRETAGQATAFAAEHRGAAARMADAIAALVLNGKAA
ncbi:3-deoxy-D-manno-octulosonic acid transferase [Piscinibacter terrae]|uniref:3-deoxy-D-manno-octulosonic acid transferase n=1 Tax=Piscinibacter terrae TaxID=2496871 RepID=A0A3N7K3Z8_9BURK|nr:3-deoxy-D-manno-octulosonic acid transferase [Albitalea terrae]RQP25645.1 3-deoxy-D-manno-octulosonic acid transferase [Albitalea terrae]